MTPNRSRTPSRTSRARVSSSAVVALSTKHTLALTNRGGATTADLLALAAEVQRGVHEAFGVWLVNEPVLVGCDLPVPSA